MLADVLDLTSRRDVGLAEVLAGAPALTRVDRKYLVPLDAVQQVLDRLGPAWAVLALPPVPGATRSGAPPTTGARTSTGPTSRPSAPTSSSGGAAGRPAAGSTSRTVCAAPR